MAEVPHVRIRLAGCGMRIINVKYVSNPYAVIVCLTLKQLSPIFSCVIFKLQITEPRGRRARAIGNAAFNYPGLRWVGVLLARKRGDRSSSSREREEKRREPTAASDPGCDS